MGRGSGVRKATVPEGTDDHDRSQAELYRFMRDSGIEKDLAKVGLTYLALVPQWDQTPEGTRVQADPKFWLNPANRNKHESGWYSLADLREWAQGRGPIIKTKEQ